MFAGAYRAGAVTKSRATAGRQVSRREAHCWALLVVAIAYWANVLRGAPPIADANALTFALDGVLAHGAFGAAAWLLVAALAARAPAGAPASRGEICGVVAISLIAVLPARQATVAALLALGSQLAIAPSGRASRQIAAILAGLALEMIWTSTYSLPLHAAVATLDAAIVRMLLGLVGIAATAHGNIVQTLAGNFDIEILAPCASSFPLAGVGLAFIVVTLYQGRLPRWSDLPWLAASLAASILLTELRLGWMATGQANYLWLHDGGGSSLYALAAALLAGMFPLLATRRPA